MHFDGSVGNMIWHHFIIRFIACKYLRWVSSFRTWATFLVAILSLTGLLWMHDMVTPMGHGAFPMAMSKYLLFASRYERLIKHFTILVNESAMSICTCRIFMALMRGLKWVVDWMSVLFSFKEFLSNCEPQQSRMKFMKSVTTFISSSVFPVSLKCKKNY